MLLRGTFRPMDDLMEDHSGVCSQRRGFLKAAGAVTGSLALGPAMAGGVPKLADTASERCLTMYAPHTGEMIRMVYWTPADGYVEESITEISHVMRDRRSNEVKRIDPVLLDQIYALQLQLRPRQPIHMLSGYRSPATNAKLRRTNKGVARASLHMRGMAADIRMPDRDFKQLHRAALDLQGGGVGRYRRSKFIHLDTGPVRSWG